MNSSERLKTALGAASFFLLLAVAHTLYFSL